MIFLVDNGSIRPEAYLNLCRVAAELSKAIDTPVSAAPLLHANKISSDLIGGKPVQILEDQLTRAIEQGVQEFVVLPFFFGESGALSDYLPKRLKRLTAIKGSFRAKILRPLYLNRSNGGDLLVEILKERIMETATSRGINGGTVLLVDHGSPLPIVTKVRNELTELLRNTSIASRYNIVAASMERRSGAEYDFNEPLLATALQSVSAACKPIVVAQLFLSPGRHAGPDGDIASICKSAETENPRLQIFRTELVGNHPKVVELLKRRYQEGLTIPMTNYSGAS